MRWIGVMVASFAGLVAGEAWADGSHDPEAVAPARRAPRLSGELVLGLGTPVGARGLQVAAGVGEQLSVVGGLGDGYGEAGLQWAAGGRWHLSDVVYLGATLHGGDWLWVGDLGPVGLGGGINMPLYHSVWLGGEVGARLPVDERLFIGGTFGLAHPLTTGCPGVDPGGDASTASCGEGTEIRALPQFGLAVGFQI